MRHDSVIRSRITAENAVPLSLGTSAVTVEPKENQHLRPSALACAGRQPCDRLADAQLCGDIKVTIMVDPCETDN